MANPTSFPGDINVPGQVTATRLVGALAKSQLDSDSNSIFAIPLTSFRVWDAFQTLLGTAGADDLGITTGAFGTAMPYLTTSDMSNEAGNPTTQYARALFQLPFNYIDGSAASLRFTAGMVTTVADVTATLDVVAYIGVNPTVAIGSDLVTTAAQSINSLTFANYTFALTPTSLVAGSLLDLRVAITIQDDAATTAVYGGITRADLLCTTRG